MADVGLMEGVMPEIPVGFAGVWDGRGERPQIIVRKFYRKTTPDPADPQKLLVDDWVEWGKPGISNWATNQRIRDIMPRTDRKRPPPPEWQVIGPAYQAWKKGEEAPVNGTPLFAWPGLPREIADALKGLGIVTVEDMANFPDDRLGRMPFRDMRSWKSRALRFVEAQGDMTATGIADKMKARDDEIDRLKAEDARKSELLEQLSTRLAAIEGGKVQQAPAKRGPGRPRKNPEPVVTHDHAIDQMADEVMQGINNE